MNKTTPYKTKPRHNQLPTQKKKQKMKKTVAATTDKAAGRMS